MLEYLFIIGVLLLTAPFICFLTKDLDEFENRCVNMMLIQAVIALVLMLIGFGVMIA